MDAFGFGSGFQTSFVVAILVAAIFLTTRLGGEDELLRRGMQVAIAFALFLTTFAATTAFIRPPDVTPSEISGSFDDSQGEEAEEYLSEIASKASGAGTVHLGVGVLLVLAAAVASRTNKVASGGALFGGVLLLLLGASFGNTGSFLDSYYSSVFGALGQADQEWDIVRLMVMAVGTILLIGYAYTRWPEPGEPAAVEAAPVAEGESTYQAPPPEMPEPPLTVE